MLSGMAGESYLGAGNSDVKPRDQQGKGLREIGTCCGKEMDGAPPLDVLNDALVYL